ncbi:MAG: hypothetical protein ACSLEW_14300 [Nocardioides sp.]
MSGLLGESFTIHSLNNYTHMGLSNLLSLFDLNSTQLQAIIRAEHGNVVKILADAGVDYAELSNALVPKPGRHEAAFIFDSTRAENGSYGYSFAETWIPVVKDHGPEKTALRVGDILQLPSQFVWRQFEGRLVGPHNFPRMACELYFAVYLTNLSPGQLGMVHSALGTGTDAYLGYVDYSTWNPLKAGLFLPQVGLRLRDRIITEADDACVPNQVGYPFEESGFLVVGVPEELYGPFLGHRIDNGVPAWADEDSAISLTVLGGDLQPATTTTVVIDESRIEYLATGHKASLSRAGLGHLDKSELADAIRQKFTNGLIYNLRFVEGSRNGEPTPELNALMYSVQVEFPDETGNVKRYQVGLKYLPETHANEVVTFF